jgi:RNA polymerase sigma factor (sigma-70 family)
MWINRVAFRLSTMTAALDVSFDTPCDDGLSVFLSARPRLFGIAYRVLGSAAEAEDIVQEVWMRWQTADRKVVRNTEAFLATTATRLAINVLQSARSRRETYVGSWLQEPVDTNSDPWLGAERGQALAFGVLVLLEKLTPTERAAYILREAFDYPYRDIANVLQLEEANARQLVTRARQRVANGRRTPANSTEHRHLLDAFTAATRNGDVAGLEGSLCGGRHKTAQHPVIGFVQRRHSNEEQDNEDQSSADAFIVARRRSVGACDGAC